jgi:hypothetical protein
MFFIPNGHSRVLSYVPGHRLFRTPVDQSALKPCLFKAKARRPLTWGARRGVPAVAQMPGPTPKTSGLTPKARLVKATYDRAHSTPCSVEALVQSLAGSAQFVAACRNNTGQVELWGQFFAGKALRLSAWRNLLPQASVLPMPAAAWLTSLLRARMNNTGFVCSAPKLRAGGGRSIDMASSVLLDQRFAGGPNAAVQHLLPIERSPSPDAACSASSAVLGERNFVTATSPGPQPRQNTRTNAVMQPLPSLSCRKPPALFQQVGRDALASVGHALASEAQGPARIATGMAPHTTACKGLSARARALADLVHSTGCCAAGTVHGDTAQPLERRAEPTLLARASFGSRAWNMHWLARQNNRLLGLGQVWLKLRRPLPWAQKLLHPDVPRHGTDIAAAVKKHGLLHKVWQALTRAGAGRPMGSIVEVPGQFMLLLEPLDLQVGDYIADMCDIYVVRHSVMHQLVSKRKCLGLGGRMLRCIEVAPPPQQHNSAGVMGQTPGYSLESVPESAEREYQAACLARWRTASGLACARASNVRALLLPLQGSSWPRDAVPGTRPVPPFGVPGRGSALRPAYEKYLIDAAAYEAASESVETDVPCLDTCTCPLPRQQHKSANRFSPQQLRRQQEQKAAGMTEFKRRLNLKGGTLPGPSTGKRQKITSSSHHAL